MNTPRLGILATTLTLAVLTAVPSANATAPAPAAADPAPAASAAADGHLHVYFDTNFRNYCAGWTGNASDWGRCRNQVSSLWNNGYPGRYDDVWVHWEKGCTQARRGVHNGVSLSNLNDWTFDRNTGRGSGERLNNNIASHCWTNL